MKPPYAIGSADGVYLCPVSPSIHGQVCPQIMPGFTSLGMCVCVCVFFQIVLDIKFVGRTSRGHTGFLTHLPSAVRALIFLARRIQPFLFLVDREVEFCVLTI